MLIIPAIDMHQGRCVRLYQGDPKKQTVYGDNPVEIACHWEKSGAKMLHLVDLDGAFTGLSVNAGVVCSIGETIDIPFQLGGGIRSEEAVIKAFSAGASRVILGTIAIEKPDLARQLALDYDERVLVGIDARDGKVAVRGWTESSALDIIELALQIEQWGIREIVYTNIHRDGTLKGPDLSGLESILKQTSLKVIMSGGISSINDLEALKPYSDRVSGVIIGKALYDNQINLQEALAVFD